jgi:hypothetical protein
MVDKDGTFSFSPIKTVKFSSLSQLQLYPNPASTTIVIDLQSAGGGNEKLEVFNATGILVQTSLISLNQGINRVTINVSALSKGVYYIRALAANQVQSFVKN